MTRARKENTRGGRGRSRRLCGFTLAEVLATLVLIGLVVPAVMRGISVALLAAAHSRHTAQAASLGEAKLTELVVTGGWGMGSAGGDFGPEWPEYRWTSESRAQDFGVEEIVLQVTWTERGAERSMVLATMVYESATTTGVLP